MSDETLEQRKQRACDMYDDWKNSGEAQALSRSAGYVVSECCIELERQLTNGAYLGWQNRQWWLFAKNGEGIESGKTIEELLFKLYT